jgi:hypothetical protein
MKTKEIKLAAIHLEVGTRMQIAELAMQLMISIGTPSLTSYYEIYNELCNKILEPLTELKDLEYVVPRMPTDAAGTNFNQF